MSDTPPAPFDALDRNSKWLTLSPAELDSYEQAIIREVTHPTRSETATFLVVLTENGRSKFDYDLAATSLLMLVGLQLNIIIMNKEKDRPLLAGAVVKWFEKMRALRTEAPLAKRLAEFKACKALAPQDAPEEAPFGNKEKSNCFIATAACGSIDAPDVETLRRFRVGSLALHHWGLAFIRLYEWVSPPLAEKIANRPALRRIVRRLVVRPLARLLG
jgi:hypothetical protein